MLDRPRDARISRRYRTVVEDYQANVVSSLETAAIRSYPVQHSRGARAGRGSGFRCAAVRRASRYARRVAYADGENTDYPAGPCPLEVQTAATVACDLTGVPLAGLSELSGRWASTIGGRWATAELLLHLDSNSRGGYNSDTSGSQIHVGSTASASPTRASAIASHGGWEVDVFARNLFDEDYITALTIQTGNSGLILGQPSDSADLGRDIARQVLTRLAKMMCSQRIVIAQLDYAGKVRLPRHLFSNPLSLSLQRAQPVLA